MNGSSLLFTLTSLLAATEVWQPDAALFERVQTKVERMPGYVRREFHKGAASLTGDCMATTNEALAAPLRAVTVWGELRANAAYNLVAAYQSLRHLPVEREAVLSPAPENPGKRAYRSRSPVNPAGLRICPPRSQYHQQSMATFPRRTTQP